MKLSAVSASWARRLSRLVLEVRRFGTGMCPPAPRLRAAVDFQRTEHRKARIPRLLGAGTLSIVEIRPAVRTEAAALFSTECPRRQGEQYLFVHERREIDLGTA